MNNSSLNILVPNLPESITDATVAVWHKKEGDIIKLNEILLELETDKIMLEIPSPKSGRLEKILEQEGSIVVSGQILACIQCVDNYDNDVINNLTDNSDTQSLIAQKNEESNLQLDSDNIFRDSNQRMKNDNFGNILVSPAIRKLIVQHGLNINDIEGSGMKGRITRQDIEKILQKQSLNDNIPVNYNLTQCNIKENDVNKYDLHDNSGKINSLTEISNRNRVDKRVTMSRLRKTIAERLLNVKNSTAILTTFNEANMRPIILLRNKYKDIFEKRYKIKLGFLSFYVKAVLEGLKQFPEINASIDGEEIVYYNYFDISIAVSTERGLVTPVLRDVDKLSISDIEVKIKALAQKGRDGKLILEDLKGGNFTITNGGVFGSLISTPIINPPQSAILGMHVIKDRPVVLNGEIIILPMMYLALSYDHRLIDGKDAVGFLVTVKNLIEDPMRLLLNI